MQLKALLLFQDLDGIAMSSPPTPHLLPATGAKASTTQDNPEEQLNAPSGQDGQEPGTYVPYVSPSRSPLGEQQLKEQPVRTT